MATTRQSRKGASSAKIGDESSAGKSNVSKAGAGGKRSRPADTGESPVVEDPVADSSLKRPKLGETGESEGLVAAEDRLLEESGVIKENKDEVGHVEPTVSTSAAEAVIVGDPMLGKF